MSGTKHIPVLLEEVLSGLDLRPGKNIIDGTVGGGGHAESILQQIAPGGKLLGLDKDEDAIRRTKQKLKPFGDRATLVNDSYINVQKQTYDHGFRQIDGILLDLGFSSDQIEDSRRGFSFQSEGPLDMRFNPADSLTAEEIINSWNQEDLSKIFRQYGEERYAREIATAIIKARKSDRITTTTQLVKVIESVVRRKGKTHPATKVFQALRIAVNDEFETVKKGLEESIKVLSPNGRLAVISFHSLEDKIVKEIFKQKETEGLIKRINKKVIKSSYEEIRQNPRARSAKLRVVQKI